MKARRRNKEIRKVTGHINEILSAHVAVTGDWQPWRQRAGGLPGRYTCGYRKEETFYIITKTIMMLVLM